MQWKNNHRIMQCIKKPFLVIYIINIIKLLCITSLIRKLWSHNRIQYWLHSICEMVGSDSSTHSVTDDESVCSNSDSLSSRLCAGDGFRLMSYGCEVVLHSFETNPSPDDLSLYVWFKSDPAISWQSVTFMQ